MRQVNLAILVVAVVLWGVDGARNILWIAADDAGYYDFESHNPSMKTPNIRRLREDGLFLNQSYVLPMCSPTRAAFMTGRYPHTFGLQDNAVNSRSVFWVNENFTMLPRALKQLNYKTHMVGKWHLGYCHPGLTPIGQGFDTFYGMWYGSHDSYYNHTKAKKVYDWWDGWNIDFRAKGHYKTELIGERAVKIINETNRSDPFFMFLSFASPHGPKQVPQWYIDTFCPNVTPPVRQIHCGMMAALDTAVGRVITALKDKGIYHKTVILFTSDNGGSVNTGGVNYPLRGDKKSVYEGGIRSYTIFKTPNMKAKNTTWPGLVYAVDWFPTLVVAAGGRTSQFDTHGKNMFRRLKSNKASSRKTFIHVDDFFQFNYTVVRYKDWKLIRAMPGLGNSTTWRPGFKQGWYPADPNDWEDVRGSYTEDEVMMYNIKEDPYERTNIYEQEKDRWIVRVINNKINKYLGENGLYPLQPFQWPQIKTNNHKKNNLPNPCWCDPPGLRDSPLCPFNHTIIQ